MLFQLPPNLKKDLPRLADFLALLPAGARAAFEFRHAVLVRRRRLRGAARARRRALHRRGRGAGDARSSPPPIGATCGCGARTTATAELAAAGGAAAAAQPWSELFVVLQARGRRPRPGARAASSREVFPAASRLTFVRLSSVYGNRSASARAIATANISFGLVSIPVKLYSAGNSSAAISFNMLHGKCGSRVKQQYVCPKEDNVVVPRDEIRKGYEFAKDQYVLFTDEELKALEEKATQTVDVTEFVPLSAIDPVYFDKAYYLGPDKGGSKAYWLFAEVLEGDGPRGAREVRGARQAVPRDGARRGRRPRHAAAPLRRRGPADRRRSASTSEKPSRTRS